jgi:hypothetical protein
VIEGSIDVFKEREWTTVRQGETRDRVRGVAPHASQCQRRPAKTAYAGMLFNRCPDEIRATGPLKGVLKGLALVGRILRFDL